MNNSLDKKALYFTIEELSKRGRDDIPKELKSGTGLVYSSPATLSYNAPGAEGFGVKRAGLSVPGSVMLIVAPGCCGRNTSEISIIPRYRHRFFYLDMNENDLITGKHLNRISEAVGEVVKTITERWKEKKPDVVMICITCVDALLGTDMERVCKKATESTGVLVKPCYMYALTREGRKPPMVHVRQSIYSMVMPQKRKGNEVNILGFFAPVMDEFELYRYLKEAGVVKVRELGRMETYDDFMDMARANFNLVLNPEAVPAAEDLKNRLKMPYIELTRFYDIEKIRRQYRALSQALGIEINDDKDYEKCLEVVNRVSEKFKGTKISIGEVLNADSFELAVALCKMGFKVVEIFALVEEEKYGNIDKLNEISKDTKVYSNMDPSMLYYDENYDISKGNLGGYDNEVGGDNKSSVMLTIGKDAAVYHKDAKHVGFNSDIQPFGYVGLIKLMEEIEGALS